MYHHQLHSPTACLFCPRLNGNLPPFHMLNKALYLKYSSSQNYFFGKDVQQHVDRARRPPVILLKDLLVFHEDEDYLTDVFSPAEIQQKREFLVEYYKYHNEIPRYFVQPSNDILNKYYDKKRRIDYYRIQKILNPDGPPEGTHENTYSQHEQSKAPSCVLKTLLQDMVTPSQTPRPTLPPDTQHSATIRDLNGYLQEHLDGSQQSSLALVDPSPQPPFSNSFLTSHFANVHQSCQPPKDLLKNVYYNMNLLKQKEDKRVKSQISLPLKKKKKETMPSRVPRTIVEQIQVSKNSVLSTSQQLFLQQKQMKQRGQLKKNPGVKHSQHSLRMDRLKQSMKSNPHHNLTSKARCQEEEVKTSQPNFFFNFNINKINVPLDVMKQLSRKWAQTNQSLSKQKIPRQRELSESNVQHHSSKKANMGALREALLKEKDRPRKEKDQLLSATQLSSAKLSLSVNKTNLQIKNNLMDLKREFVPSAAPKPVSLNQGQLQGLLKKVSEQINRAKQPVKKQNLRSSSQNHIESSLHRLKRHPGEEGISKTAPRSSHLAAQPILQSAQAIQSVSNAHFRSVSSLVQRKDFIQLNKDSLKRQHSNNPTQSVAHPPKKKKPVPHYNPKDILKKEKIKTKLATSNQYKNVYDKFMAKRTPTDNSHPKDAKVFNSQIIKQLHKYK